jgi:cullin 1
VWTVVGFKSKKISVNINLPIKAETVTKTESTDVLKTVDEERKYVIQATIVR